MDRKLVTVRQVDDIFPIPDADAIEVAVFGGWNVVVKKNDFKPGDLAVYFEIDSFLPENDFRFQFLMKNKITWEGHDGARLKTIRLRKQLSQGLAMPLSEFPEVEQQYDGTPQNQDFSELLNVLKWEKPIPAQLRGLIKGNFPSILRKTDQERAQNMVKEIFAEDRTYEISIKLEGSSMTIYKLNGVVGVCSRNQDLKLEDEANAFVDTAINTMLLDFLENSDIDDIAFQGELMGPGIQGNHEGLESKDFYLFDIYDAYRGRYLTADERLHLVIQHDLDIEHVPIIGNKKLSELGITNIQELIAYADGPSLKHKCREGLVFKDVNDSSFTFKVISNEYLIKHN